MELEQPLEQTPEQQADAMAGSGLRTVMKRALPASAKGPLDEKIVPPIKIAGEDEYNALNPGMRYIDPEGNTRTKDWSVASEEDYDLVPEGKDYVDPEGNRRIKPAYEDVDLTASTLYHMAVNDTERRKALERSYPGKVQQDTQGRLYVDEDGKRRRPKNLLESPTGAVSTLAGAAAPMIAGAAGEIGGGIAGTAALPGPGTLGGAVAGAGLGGAAGQGFNDIILQLAGVYDRSGGEEAANLAAAGGFSAVGSGVGRSIGGMVGGTGGIKQAVKSGAGSGVAAKFLGADPEGLETAIGLREKGVLVPPSGWAKEAPHIQNVVEVFDPAFHTQKPLLQSATEHYEKTGAGILDQFGVKDAGSLTQPKEAVPTQKAGEAVLARTLRESKTADDELRRVLDERRTQLQSGLPAAQERRSALDQAAENSRREAQRLIDQGYQQIQQTTDQAARLSGAGHNSGDLWAMVGERLQAVKRGLQERATTMYNQADELAGGHLPNVQGLPELAEQFASQLPEEFERNQPALVRQLRSMAGDSGLDAEGNQARPPVPPSAPTFGQLHNLRSQIRSNADFYRLNSDIKNGTYKFFARRVDEALHDPHAVPELQAAARQLDRSDAFYRENMPIFEANQIKSVMRGLESGEPADPQRLFDTVVKEGHTDLTNRIREMVGPNLWAGVQAADLQQILNSSRGLVPGEIDGRAFTRQVLDRYRSGVLDAVHGRDVTQRLLRQAQDVAMMEGRLPLTVRPGDRLTDVIAQARASADAAREAARADPIRTLNTEMKRIEREHAQAASKARAERKNDPLGFLYDPTTGATEAVNRILNSEDLLLAAAGHFDPKSPEFNMLRQVWAQRLLQGTLEPSARLAKISPEVQNIMFPGTTLQDMQRLAKEMDFLMASKATDAGAGLSMSATAKVERPWSSIAGGGGVAKLITKPLSIFPGDPAGRFLLGEYYKLVRTVSNNVAFMKWVQKGLKGDDAARETVKEAVQRAMKVGGATGAAIGESQYQAGLEGVRQPPQENSGGGNQIPQFAEGGIVTQPTVAMIGEAGPEAVVPLDNPAMAQQAADVAAARTKAPYAHAAARQGGLDQGFMDIANYYGNNLMSALTGPQDAFTGALQVNDSEGMPTPQAMKRGMGVANLAFTSGMPMAQKGAAGMAGGKLTQPHPEVTKTFPEATLNQRGDHVLPLADGKGAVEFKVDPNTVTMSASYLDKSERGKGVASEAYRRIVDWALASGRDVKSHGAPQADARKLYESLSDKGYQVERNKNLAGQTEYRITGKAGGKLGVAGSEETVAGQMAGVNFKVTDAQYAELQAARKAGAGKAEIQEMVDKFKGKTGGGWDATKEAQYREYRRGGTFRPYDQKEFEERVMEEMRRTR